MGHMEQPSSYGPVKRASSSDRYVAVFALEGGGPGRLIYHVVGQRIIAELSDGPGCAHYVVQLHVQHLPGVGS